MGVLQRDQVLQEESVLGQFVFSAPFLMGGLQRSKQKRTLKNVTLSYFAFLWFWCKFTPVFGVSAVFGGLLFGVLEKNLSLLVVLGPQACWLITGVSGLLVGLLAVSRAASSGWLGFPGWPIQSAVVVHAQRRVSAMWARWK